MKTRISQLVEENKQYKSILKVMFKTIKKYISQNEINVKKGQSYFYNIVDGIQSSLYLAVSNPKGFDVEVFNDYMESIGRTGKRKKPYNKIKDKKKTDEKDYPE